MYMEEALCLSQSRMDYPSPGWTLAAQNGQFERRQIQFQLTTRRIQRVVSVCQLECILNAFYVLIVFCL